MKSKNTKRQKGGGGFNRALDLQLVEAVSNGKIEEVTKLLDKGANINATFSDKVPAIMTAIINNDINMIGLLIKSGVDLDIQNGYALSLASSNGNIEVVDMLLKAKPDIKINPVYTPLAEAANKNNYEMVKHLLKIFPAMKDDGRALYIAARTGNLDILRILLSNTKYTDKNKGEALSKAVLYNQLNIVKELIAKDADIHVGFDAPLRHAITRKNVEILKVLLNAGADPNNGNGVPLSSAAKNGDLEIVKMLLDNRANFRGYKDTAVINAILYNRDKSLIELLVNKYLTKEYETIAVDICNRIDDSRVLASFLQYGLDPSLFTPEMIESWNQEKKTIIQQVQREKLARMIYKFEKSSRKDFPDDARRIIEDKMRDSNQVGGADYIIYKGRKYKVHIGKKGGRYILVRKNKTKVYI